MSLMLLPNETTTANWTQGHYTFCLCTLKSTHSDCILKTGVYSCVFVVHTGVFCVCTVKFCVFLVHKTHTVCVHWMSCVLLCFSHVLLCTAEKCVLYTESNFFPDGVADLQGHASNWSSHCRGTTLPKHFTLWEQHWRYCGGSSAVLKVAKSRHGGQNAAVCVRLVCSKASHAQK